MMEKLKFYPNEPGILKKVGRFALGTSIWWSPAFLMSVMDMGMLPIGVFYGLLAGTWAYPKTRGYVKEANDIFWGGFERYCKSVEVSRTLRETLEGAGLTGKEVVETKEGKMEYVIYPRTEIREDEFNLYFDIRMLPGQTRKQWEQKIDSIAQAFEGRIASATIGEGKVKIQVNRGAWDAGEVLYKFDVEPYLFVGVDTKGRFKWAFNRYPHALIVGLTGSGKSTFMRNLLIQFPNDWIVRILDGKRIEFSFMRNFGYDVGYDANDFVEYVREAREEMMRRAEVLERKGQNEYVNDPEMKPYFLIIDEFIFLIEEIPKKRKDDGPTREEVWSWIQDISLRGRALGVFLILITQRPDSDFLPTVVRDNLTLKVLLGGSETALQMTFGKEKSKGLELFEDPGTGYLMVADGEVRPFRFPFYSLECFKKDLEVKRRGQLYDLEQEREKRRKGVAEQEKGAVGG